MTEHPDFGGQLVYVKEVALDRQPELSQRGCERVLEMYTWKKTAADYVAVSEPGASDRIETYLDEVDS